MQDKLSSSMFRFPNSIRGQTAEKYVEDRTRLLAKLKQNKHTVKEKTARKVRNNT